MNFAFILAGGPYYLVAFAWGEPLRKPKILTGFSTGPCKMAFDRARGLPYTSLFVRDVTNLSGAAPDVLESLSWKGIIFGPGTSKTEWDGRAAGMGRLPRKAE